MKSTKSNVVQLPVQSIPTTDIGYIVDNLRVSEGKAKVELFGIELNLHFGMDKGRFYLFGRKI